MQTRHMMMFKWRTETMVLPESNSGISITVARRLLTNYQMEVLLISSSRLLSFSPCNLRYFQQFFPSGGGGGVRGTPILSDGSGCRTI